MVEGKKVVLLLPTNWSVVLVFNTRALFVLSAAVTPDALVFPALACTVRTPPFNVVVPL
jgi:hypothetical protein